MTSMSQLTCKQRPSFPQEAENCLGCCSMYAAQQVTRTHRTVCTCSDRIILQMRQGKSRLLLAYNLAFFNWHLGSNVLQKLRLSFYAQLNEPGFQLTTPHVMHCKGNTPLQSPCRSSGVCFAITVWPMETPDERQGLCNGVLPVQCSM